MESVYRDYMAVKEKFKGEVKMFDEMLFSSIRHPKILRPTIDYKPSELNPYPPEIDPNNWTELTKEEIKAHEERLAIRGRMRRHFWQLAYHPKHDIHFKPALADPAIKRYENAQAVYFRMHSHNLKHLTTKEILGIGLIMVTPVFLCLLIDRAHAKRHPPVVK